MTNVQWHSPEDPPKRSGRYLVTVRGRDPQTGLETNVVQICRFKQTKTTNGWFFQSRLFKLLSWAEAPEPCDLSSRRAIEEHFRQFMTGR
ncbi:MAG: hypothetical protein J6Y20_07385 [Lachnospiraceae bacterium]|nr:hypothetical protein [Lachnospiraceae bacterium]